MTDSSALVVVLLPFIGKELPTSQLTKTLPVEQWATFAEQLTGLVGYKVDHDATGVNLRSARLDVNNNQFRITRFEQVQKLNITITIGASDE